MERIIFSLFALNIASPLVYAADNSAEHFDDAIFRNVKVTQYKPGGQLEAAVQEPQVSSSSETNQNCTQVGLLGGIPSESTATLKSLANSSTVLSLTNSSELKFTPPQIKPGESTQNALIDPNAPKPDSKLTQISSIGSDLAQISFGQDLVKSAEVAQDALRNAAEEDQTYLGTNYRSMDRKQLQEHFNRATENLTEAIKSLDQGKSNLEEGDLARLKNTYMNALDKAQAAKELLAENSAFKNQLSPSEHPLAKTPELKDLFPNADDPKTKATSSDAVTDRILMLNGLPKNAQEKILSESKLKFADYIPFKMRDESIKKIAILHNGSAGGSTDCSQLITTLLTPDARKGNFTTLDFRTMWIYKKRGYFPNPPEYPAQKAKLLKETAEAFTPVNLYEGETLIPGDLLVHRVPWEPTGHVYIVKSYNSNKMTAEVIEASKTAGSIRQTTFSTLDPTDSSKRNVRLGLIGLRINPAKNNACKTKVAQITQR